MELQRFSLATEKIRVELDLDPTLPFVHGDAGQLQHVLINLLGNARQALEEQGQGGVIRLRTRKAGERRVLLEVKDSGPGIPQAIQARIFDPFFTTKPAGVGTGLGLSIVLSVVREHGGQVRVQSPPQGGALFQIEIPAASERQREDA
jgi:two-component system, NtrC family, sensor kinase